MLKARAFSGHSRWILNGIGASARQDAMSARLGYRKIFVWKVPYT
jgi:hypothetical protein